MDTRARSVTLGFVLVCSLASGFAEAVPTRAGEQPKEHYSLEHQAASEERDADRLRGADLARELPGLEVATELPRLVFYPALSVRVPYQVLGLGATVEGMPLEWLRLSALYSFGISPADNSVVWSSYAEAMLGVRLFAVSAEDRVGIRLKQKKVGLFTSFPEELKAWVPSRHALFVEVGALTGFSTLETCADCEEEDGSEPPPDDRQLVMPFGGIRYVYGYDLRSKGRNLRARVLLQLYAHAIAMPLNAPEEPRYFPNGTSAGKAGFGGRVGIFLPPLWTCIAELVIGLGCLDGNIAVGYAPYPRIVLFEVQVGSAFF